MREQVGIAPFGDKQPVPDRFDMARNLLYLRIVHRTMKASIVWSSVRSLEGQNRP
jgi:hypothetical protein